MKFTLRSLAFAALVASSPTIASAGCLTGAAVGGVAGHVAGHHGVLGAAAGCAIGHHHAVVKRREARDAAAYNAHASQSANPGAAGAQGQNAPQGPGTSNPPR